MKKVILFFLILIISPLFANNLIEKIEPPKWLLGEWFIKDYNTTFIFTESDIIQNNFSFTEAISKNIIIEFSQDVWTMKYFVKMKDRDNQNFDFIFHKYYSPDIILFTSRDAQTGGIITHMERVKH